MAYEVDLNPATMALHVDRDLECNHGIAPPIMQSVTYFADDDADFAFKAEEPLHDLFYARHGNPTCSRIAKIIAHLECGETAMMFGSGMGAITTAVLAYVSAGPPMARQNGLAFSDRIRLAIEWAGLPRPRRPSSNSPARTGRPSRNTKAR